MEWLGPNYEFERFVDNPGEAVEKLVRDPNSVLAAAQIQEMASHATDNIISFIIFELLPELNDVELASKYYELLTKHPNTGIRDSAGYMPRLMIVLDPSNAELYIDRWIELLMDDAGGVSRGALYALEAYEDNVEARNEDPILTKQQLERLQAVAANLPRN